MDKDHNKEVNEPEVVNDSVENEPKEQQNDEVLQDKSTSSALEDEKVEKQVVQPPIAPLEKEEKKNVYDPLSSFNDLTSKLAGLPPMQGVSAPEKKEEKHQEQKTESTSEDLKKKDAQSVDYKEKVSDYDFVDSQKHEDKKVETTEKKGARARLTKRGAKAMVNGGDKAQATLAQVVFDWRASGGLEKAKEDRDKLVKKVTSNHPLDDKEKAILAYAQEYINKHEQSKEQFSRQINFLDDDKEELIGLLEDYFALSDFEPSPVFTILLIVGATLFANFYAAFTMHPSYNPPTGTK